LQEGAASVAAFPPLVLANQKSSAKCTGRTAEETFESVPVLNLAQWHEELLAMAYYEVLFQCEIRRYSSQYSTHLRAHPNGLVVNLIELPDNKTPAK
jgi:hypothetical protein